MMPQIKCMSHKVRIEPVLVKISLGCREGLMKTEEIIRMGAGENGEQVMCGVDSLHEFSPLGGSHACSCSGAWSWLLTGVWWGLQALRTHPGALMTWAGPTCCWKEWRSLFGNQCLIVSRSWRATSVWNILSKYSWTSDAYLLKPESRVWQVPT